jgi:hypothetical protein
LPAKQEQAGFARRKRIVSSVNCYNTAEMFFSSSLQETNASNSHFGEANLIACWRHPHANWLASSK